MNHYPYERNLEIGGNHIKITRKKIFWRSDRKLKSMRCHKCGNEVKDNSLFCSKCGAKMKKEGSNESLKQTNRILKISVIYLSILVVVVMSFMIFITLKVLKEQDQAEQIVSNNNIK